MTFARNGASPNGHAPKQLDHEWETGARWQGVLRSYTAEEVLRLRGPVLVEHTLARLGAERLWRLLATEDYVAALGGMTGGQAVQMAKAGLKAIYLSGWQVAADANLAGQTYPDQSLYPADSAPALVRRLNNALLRAGQGLEAAISRSLAYAAYADVLWFETSTPDLGEAREFAHAIHERFPGKLLAYNCSPSFNWRRSLEDDEIATFQEELGALGYRFQFVTLAGFHKLESVAERPELLLEGRD